MPLINPLGGYEFLGSTVLGSGAATTASVAFDARDLLLVQIRVTGYGGSDIASLRFNGDTGANYSSRYLSSAAAATTFSNNTFQSNTFARCFAVGVTTGRSALVAISNNLGTTKCGAVSALTGTGAVATAPGLELGGFEWVNTAAQITSMLLVTAGGANLNTGTGFAVFGRNLS